MGELEPYIAPTIPDYIWYACFGFVSIVALFAIRFCSSRAVAFQWTSLSVLISYLLVVYCNTVILRDTMGEPQFHLELFWSYGLQDDGSSHYLENALNILLFVPIGLLCGCLSKRIRWWMVILFGVFISSSIEIMQYVLQKGIFEFDDIIHNTIGTFMGYGVYVIIAKLFKSLRAVRNDRRT